MNKFELILHLSDQKNKEKMKFRQQWEADRWKEAKQIMLDFKAEEKKKKVLK